MFTTKSMPFSVRMCLLYNRLFKFRTRWDNVMRERLAAENRRKVDALAQNLHYAEFEFGKAGRFFRPFGEVPLNGKRVLDFGCLYGGASVWYASQGAAQVTGIDISEDFLSTARQFTQIKCAELADPNVTPERFTFRKGSSRNIPVDDATIDMIMSCDVVEHLEDPAAIIDEWWRVLAPGGRAYLRFGPLWYHPHGVHLWEVFPGPWSHVLFSERTCVLTRNFVKGYQTTQERWDDMNKMTLRWFKRLVRASQFTVLMLKPRCMFGLQPLRYLPWIREFFLSGIDCVLEKADV